MCFELNPAQGMCRYWTESGAGHQDNEWHLFTLVNYDHGGTQKFVGYVDGVLRTLEGGTVPATSGSTDVGATYHTRIGARDHGAGSPTGFFTGSIDEVAIWDTALSSSQVKTLYNNREPFNAKNIALSNLKAYYRMGDGILDARITKGLVADQVNATLGSELLITTGWSTDDGWTLSGGTLTFSDTGNGGTILTAGEMTNGTGMAIGKVYKLQYTISNLSSRTADITIHNSDGNVQIANENATNGSYTKYFTPTHDGKGFRFTGLASSGSSWDVTDYSLKEVSGNAGVMVNFDGSDFKTDTH